MSHFKANWGKTLKELVNVGGELWENSSAHNQLEDPWKNRFS